MFSNLLLTPWPMYVEPQSLDGYMNPWHICWPAVGTLSLVCGPPLSLGYMNLRHVCWPAVDTLSQVCGPPEPGRVYDPLQICWPTVGTLSLVVYMPPWHAWVYDPLAYLLTCCWHAEPICGPPGSSRVYEPLAYLLTCCWDPEPGMWLLLPPKLWITSYNWWWGSTGNRQSLQNLLEFEIQGGILNSENVNVHCQTWENMQRFIEQK